MRPVLEARSQARPAAASSPCRGYSSRCGGRDKVAAAGQQSKTLSTCRLRSKATLSKDEVGRTMYQVRPEPRQAVAGVGPMTAKPKEAQNEFEVGASG